MAFINPRIQSEDETGVFQKVVDTESKGKQYDSSGKILKSSKGAEGATQVVPKTQKDPGFGVAPMKDKSEQEFMRFGQDYLNALHKHFNKDTEKAVAAYNAGPGTVEKLVAEHGENWKDHLPEETKQYIKKTVGEERPQSTKQAFVNPGSQKGFVNPKSVNQIDESNWAGTGAKESFSDYMAGGFAGRTIVGMANTQGLHDQAVRNVEARLGKKDKAMGIMGFDDMAFSSEVLKEQKRLTLEKQAKDPVRPPEPSIKDSLSAFAKMTVEHPWTTAKGMLYELGRDPELIAAPWLAAEGTVAKAGVGAVKMGSTAIKLTKGAMKAGSLGVALETSAEYAENKGIDVQRVANTAATFAVLGTAMGVLGEGGKKVFGKGDAKTAETKTDTKVPPKEETVSERIARAREERRAAKGEARKSFVSPKEAEEVANHESILHANEAFEPTDTRSAAKVMKDYLRGLLADNWKAEVWGKDITKAVPDEKIRARMTMAAEGAKSYDKIYTDAEKHAMLNGDGKGQIGMKGALGRMQARLAMGKFKTLDDRLAYETRAKNLEFVINHLEELPSEEHAIPVLESIQKTIKGIGEQAKKLGIVDGLLKNYIPHMLDFKEFKGTEAQKIDIMERIFGQPKDSKFVRDFSEHRFYDTIRDLEGALEGTGIIVQKDIAKVAEAYMKSMLKSIAEKKMTDHFLKATIEGDPILTKDLSEGIRLGYELFKGKGSKALEGMMVHPDFVDLFKFAYQQKDPNMFLRAASSITMLTKSLETTASLFHFKSLLEAQTIAAPGMMFKELFSAGSGIRKATQAFRDGDKDGGHNIDEWIRNGLVLGTEDVDKTIVGKTGEWVDNQLSRFGPKVELLQKATGPLDKHIIQNLNKVTWDYAHTGGKINIANHFFTKMKTAHPEMEDAKIRQEVASFVNNTLGGLDWLEVAENTNNKVAKAIAMKAAGVQGRAWFQILMFAPDWTVSTIRSMSEALPREILKNPLDYGWKEGMEGFFNPKSRQDLARRYVFNTAVTYFTVMNGLNIAMSGHPVWENKDPYKLEVGDGTKIQMAKHSMEVPEMIESHGVSIGAKLGFIPKAISIATIGRTNPFSPKTSIKKDSAYMRAREIVLGAAPFPISSAISAPAGEGTKRAVASMLGAPIMGQTDTKHTDREVLKERAMKRLETEKENAAKKRKKNK